MEHALNFDPSVKYRNLLIAMSRNIKKFERKAKEMEALRERWATLKAKDFLYAARTMHYTMSRQSEACLYYFNTEDVEIISQVPMQGDFTSKEFDE